ncbi:MAG: CCDC90 family protein [Haliea sp.]|nr:CCDC90 family protein [Haliea sp.]
MTAVQFDTLQYARRLRAAGVAQEQAEVQAELMAEAFGFYVDNLVTKDYLDVRFAQQDAKIDARFAHVEGTLRLHSVLLAVNVAAVVVPQLSALFLR